MISYRYILRMVAVCPMLLVGAIAADSGDVAKATFYGLGAIAFALMCSKNL